jgi:putative GTP pyrophosphokinase
MNEEIILEEYKKGLSLYDSLKIKSHSLLDDLCKVKSIQIHSISSRLKDEDSLKRKILNKGEKYNSINDITDIVGIRIITMFEDDVEKVEKVIKNEFNIDPNNSGDKFQKLNSNEFGYRSVHCVCSIGTERGVLAEYRDISSLKLEIQVRSILQHAWADIEHDLGYKFETDLPEHIRRDFSRVAGLLELADMEFLRIKKEIKRYSDNLKINDKSKNIPINVISFDKFLEKSVALNQIDLAISKTNDIPIQGNFRGSQMMKILTLLDINNLNDLEHILKERKEELINFSSKWIKGQKLLRRGLCVWTLAYIIMAERGEEELEQYLKLMNIGGTEYLATNSERIFKTIEEIKNT